MAPRRSLRSHIKQARDRTRQETIQDNRNNAFKDDMQTEAEISGRSQESGTVSLQEQSNPLHQAPAEKHIRQSYTQAQKSELRERARSNPKPSQKELMHWFHQIYGVTMSQSSLSCILSETMPDLDSHAAEASQKRRQRPSMFPELEEALFEEQQQLQDQGTTVSGDMLKQIGKRLWSEMEIYRTRPVPAFSNGWLQGFKSRYQMPVRSKRRRIETSRTPTPHRTTLQEAAVSASPGIHAVSSSEQPAADRRVTPPFKVPPRRHPPMPYYPRPAYDANAGSPLYADRKLYMRIAATASESGDRVLTHQHLIPPRSGYAWAVPAGHVVRIVTPSGPQVGDLNIWSLHNPRERFWAARTRQLHASHVRIYDRLWSCLPYLRPMVTVTADSLAGYGVDARGGRCHDLLGTRCDPYVRKMLTRGSEAGQEGEEFDFHCHSNLVRAVLPWGLAESDVHDVLNVFQVTGLDHEGRYFMAPSPAVGANRSHDDVARSSGVSRAVTAVGADESCSSDSTSHSREGAGQTALPTATAQTKQGHPLDEGEADFFEFFAEIDVLCALSACPGGDLSCWEWSDEAAMRSTCRPLAVQVFSISDHVRDHVLQGWRPPVPNDYMGRHGMTIPSGEA